MRNLEQPDLGIDDYKFYQLLQQGGKLTRSQLNKLGGKDSKTPDVPSALAKLSGKKKKDEKALVKTKSSKADDSEDLQVGDIAKKKVKKSKDPSPVPIKRSLSQPTQSIAPLNSAPVVDLKRLEKQLVVEREESAQKEPPKPKLQNVVLDTPVYSFPFCSYPTERLHIKNDLVLGMAELRGRNIKVLQKGESENEIRLLNAVISKKMKVDDRVHIEFIDQKPAKYHHLKKNLKNIEELKHRDFFLCQEVAVVETNPIFLEKINVDSTCGLKYWPVIVMNNASKDLKSRALTEALNVKIVDDFACLESGEDITAAVKDLRKEGIVLQNVQTAGIMTFGQVLSDHEPILIDDDIGSGSGEVLSIFKLTKGEGGDENLSSMSFTPNSKVDFDLFSELHDDSDKRELLGDAGMQIEAKAELEEAAERVSSPMKLEIQIEIEESKANQAEVKLESNSEATFDVKVETKIEPPSDIKSEHKSEDHPAELLSTIRDQIKEETKVDLLKKEEYTEEDLEKEVLVWYIGTNIFEMYSSNKVYLLNKEMRDYFHQLSKRSASFNNVMVECSQFIRNYNGSTEHEGNYVAVTETSINDNLFKFSQIKTDNAYVYYAVPLKVLQQGQQKSILVRYFDVLEERIKLIKLGVQQNFIRSLGPLPTLSPDYLDSINSDSYDFHSFNTIKAKLFPDYFPSSLIDQNTQRDVLHIREKIGIVEKLPELTKAERMANRCKKCNFIIGEHSYYICLKCKDLYHDNENCISDMVGPNTDRETWICPNCKACELCFSKKIREGEDMIHCTRCDRTYHSECHVLVMNGRNIPEASRAKFVCENCARCSMCEGELTSYMDAKLLEDGSAVCEDCFKSQLKKEYCPVCRKKWDASNIEMIECNCQMWIHRQCDPELSKDLFLDFSTTGKVYFCPLCRKQQKNNQIVDFIALLSELDEYKFFENPVDTEIIPNYKLVIEKPMDFYSMIKKAKEYYYIDTNAEAATYDLLMNDFNLICDNAMIYNMPKSNIYVQAKKLKKIGHYAFMWFQSLINQPTREFLKGIRKKVAGPLKADFTREIEEYYYDILFSEPSANPLTKIRLLDSKKFAINPIKKNDNKEIVIEITGLNYLLGEKGKDDRRITEQMQTRKQIQAEQDFMVSAIKEEMIGEANFSNNNRESELMVWDNSEAKKQMTTGYSLKKYSKEIFGFIDELLNINPKNKPFFYFTSIFLQFSNPALLIEDVCYLCGAFGDREAFLRCESCSESFHHYCVSKSYAHDEKLELLQGEDKTWLCPKCKTCENCHKKSEFFDCLICEKCDKLYHLQCLYSNITVVFPAYWRCHNCFSCENCGSNKVINEELLAYNSDSNNSIYPEFCEDFKYCYECGLKLAYYKFCRICKKYCQKCLKGTRALTNSAGEKVRGLQYINPVEDSVECTKCGYYYHLVCYQEDFGKFKDFDNFVCYYCKQEYSNLDNFLHNTMLKGEGLRTKIKNAKSLLKICEQIVAIKKNDEVESRIPEFVCENYRELINNNSVKMMLENFKYLDPATKILAQKDATSVSKIEPWEIILDCWNWQTLSLESSLEVKLLHHQKEFEINVPAHDAWMMGYAHPFKRPKNFLEQINFHHAVKVRSVMGEFSGFGLDGTPRFISSIPTQFIEEDPAQQSPNVFELLNSDLWTYQEAYKNFKREQERFSFCLTDVTQEGNTIDNAQFIQEYFFMYASSLVETRYDCIKRRQSRMGNLPLWLIAPSTAIYLRHIANSSGFECPVGSLQSKDDFPFMMQNPALSQRSTIESFKARDNYSSYEELANMLINEMKAVEFLRLRFSHWQAQSIAHGRFQPEAPALKFTGSAYKPSRTDFNTHRISQSSSNTNSRPALSYSKDKHHDDLIEGSKHDYEQEHEHEDEQEQDIKIEDNIKIEHENSPRASTSTFHLHNTGAEGHMMSESEDSSHQKHAHIPHLDEVMIPESHHVPDDMKEGPIDNMECICCKNHGDRALSGRLIFVDFDQWVHTNCALWSYDVYEDIEGGLINFLIAYKRGLTCMCLQCGKSGATLICNSKKCQNKFHFRCALEASCSFLTSKKFYCKSCSLSKNLSNRLINDFSTKRRLYVKRNQHFFNPEGSKNPKYVKEKPLDFNVGGFARIGGLSLLALKRLNIDTKLLFSEYYAVRMIEDSVQKTREPLLMMLELKEKGYNIRMDFIDRNELTRINFLQRQLSGELGERLSWINIEGIERLQELMRKILNRKEFRPQFKDFMGDFLGMYNEDVRTWLKGSYVKEGEELSRPENPSFDKCFYSEDLDDLNPFEKSEKVGELYATFIQKVAKIITIKDDTDRFKNPRDRSFHPKVTSIKAGKRKGDNLAASLDLVHDRVVEGDEDLIELGHEAGKISKIFSNELELKLKKEYMTYRKRTPKVFVAPSPIHKYGLFALENFNKNEIVIEYCGELVRNKIADRREDNYRKQGFGDCYMFRIEKDLVVDASFKGNQARYLNHSCDPNCSSVVVEVDGTSHIIIYANRAIYAGEELTYDYQFDIETEKIECTCGAKNCLGRLN